VAPEDTAQPVSPEAFERVRRERDTAQSQLTEAAAALRDVGLRDRFYEHFRQDPTIRDPYGLAAQAIQNVTLKGLTPDQVPERLTAWLSDQRRLLSQPEPEAPAEGEQGKAEAKAPPSPYQGPNPGAPGYQARVEPMIVGGERWQEWSKGKSADEKLAAMRRGDAVSSDKVQRFQGTAKRGAN